MRQDDDAQGGSRGDHEVGHGMTAYNNSHTNSQNGRADAHRNSTASGAAFWRWLKAWPKPPTKTLEMERRLWFALTDEQRASCITLTPVFLDATKDKSRLSSPSVYLRLRRWESVEALPAATAPERVVAKRCGKLWMAWRFWFLLQPSRPVSLAPVDRKRVEAGELDLQIELRKARVRGGWPAVNDMGAEFGCSAVLKALATDFRQTQPGDPVFMAWHRLHDRRGWPFIDYPTKWVYFPPVDDLTGDLDAQVEAALAVFEKQANEVMNAQ